eukprot:4420459-Pleurochrysis_carterae.AAC.3
MANASNAQPGSMTVDARVLRRPDYRPRRTVKDKWYDYKFIFTRSPQIFCRSARIWALQYKGKLVVRSILWIT